jgi:HK97 family phage portal protein
MLYPQQIELLNPSDVRVTLDDKGQLKYAGASGAEIPRQDMFHVRAFRMPGLAVGLSPIQYAAVAINRDKAIQDFSLGYFKDAPHPSSVLTSDQPVNQEQARTVKERLMATVLGREPLVLGAGLKFTPLSVSPEESQFLATQKYGVAEIARIFGVPPEKIAAEAGNSMTYANVESAGIDFLTYSIQWWLTLLEAALSPLFPGKKHVRFDPSVLLRTDLHTRLNATAVGIASHQLLPDEARAMGDLPPFTAEQKKEADLVPMTVSPSGRPLALPGSAPAGIDATEPATPAATVTKGAK